MYIERDAFKRILGPVEEILKRNQDKYKQFVMQWSECIKLLDIEIFEMEINRIK